ncbi:MAG: type III-A CRISPR-associated RAMP protein Csm3 [Candidatus Zixiibacteriota bacterium]|nr:MAG: type III-A CRISPR-associated RAMP protein Csm3 [candidate division Zixibacteria bacterium]
MTENNIGFGLIGKVIILSDIKTLTGIRVGGSSGGLKIGGVDQNVITDSMGIPYIPGSSIKGKLRSITEHVLAKNDPNYFDKRSGQRRCANIEEYKECSVSQIFGTMLSTKHTDADSVNTLTRLYTRDTYLDESSITDKMHSNIDLPYTEVKYETAIDRINGNAAHGSLRQIERVPAGAIFKDSEMIFNIYMDSDKNLLKHLFTSMMLLEDDYLGGMGSRGYGKIKFENIRIYWNTVQDYESANLRSSIINENMTSIQDVAKNIEQIITKLV